VVGGLCQHSAAAVAAGVADDGLPTEFPHSAAAEDVLHTDRVDLKPSRFAGRRFAISGMRAYAADDRCLWQWL